MNILLDATTPPRWARALGLLAQPEHVVSHVRDVLGNDASDRNIHDYLQAHPESVVIGQDLDAIEQPHRLAAMKAWGHPVFLLSPAWSTLKPWTQTWMLVHRFPAMMEKARKAAGPMIYVVPPVHKGHIRKLA